jgi:hypothetical protein
MLIRNRSWQHFGDCFALEQVMEFCLSASGDAKALAAFARRIILSLILV